MPWITKTQEAMKEASLNHGCLTFMMIKMSEYCTDCTNQHPRTVLVVPIRTPVSYLVTQHALHPAGYTHNCIEASQVVVRCKVQVFHVYNFHR